MTTSYIFTDRSALDTAVEAWITDEAAAIETYGDINTWDVSGITDFSWLFRLTSFNSDISDWDVSNGTNFSAMFNYNGAFNQDISGWDVSNATRLDSMFMYASGFDQDISNWEISNEAHLTHMFHGANRMRDRGVAVTPEPSYNGYFESLVPHPFAPADRAELDTAVEAWITD